jgi:hypothetical protein
LVAWSPQEGRFDLMVRGAEHNDLARVAIFDEDAAVMDAVEASETTEASLTFHVHCPQLDRFHAPPPSAMQTAARDFGAMLLVPTDAPLTADSNDIMVPILAPQSVAVHAELELLECSAPQLAVQPATPEAGACLRSRSVWGL